MGTYKFNELLNEIRTNLMAYIWAGDGDEIDASYNLETIFTTINDACRQYEELWNKYSDLVMDKVKLENELTDLRKKIRELEK